MKLEGQLSEFVFPLKQLPVRTSPSTPINLLRGFDQVRVNCFHVP